MANPHQIIDLSRRIGKIAEAKISRINQINRATSYLALNALIEASKAGAAGDGFGVVAREVKHVSGQISELSGELADELTKEIVRLRSGRAKLNSAISGNSGRRAGPRKAWREGVFDGQEVSAPHAAHP